MKKLIKRILELENISKELEPSEAKRNKYFQQIQDYTNYFINDIEETKAYSVTNVKHGVLSINGCKKPLSRLLQVYADEVVDKGKRGFGRHIDMFRRWIYTSAC